MSEFSANANPSGDRKEKRVLNQVSLFIVSHLFIIYKSGSIGEEKYSEVFSVKNAAIRNAPAFYLNYSVSVPTITTDSIGATSPEASGIEEDATS